VDVFAGRRDHPAQLMKVVGRAVVEAFGLDDGNVVVLSPTPIPIAWTGATERYTPTVS
jgi:hypothetical protein